MPDEALKPATDYLEQQRHECEVRHVAKLGTNDERRDYIAGVRKARGREAADRLRSDVWEFMQKHGVSA